MKARFKEWDTVRYSNEYLKTLGKYPCDKYKTFKVYNISHNDVVALEEIWTSEPYRLHESWLIKVWFYKWIPMEFNLIDEYIDKWWDKYYDRYEIRFLFTTKKIVVDLGYDKG